MADESNAGLTYLPVPEFLAGLERSGALPDSKWRELRERLDRMTDLDDSVDLARRLIKEGTLTQFQARRLLKGKKSLSLGRYALVDHLGQGARGRVFKARHRLMDRMVAIKVILPDGALSETVVARFFREMKIVGLLDSPYVVRAIDADVHEGRPYIVMEYLEGEDLEKVSARCGPMPPEDVIAYMAQVARGLAHAHEKGVIHRDVKPTNVFLVNSGLVKVLDLGFGELVGTAMRAGNVFDTDEGVVVGTHDFMSPEQVKDNAVDARTDLFSLGCTMYRLLTRAYAFPGVTREDRLIKRIRERHVPITDVRPGLSRQVVAIVDRLLAVSPDDRFSSAAEAAEALEVLIPSNGRPRAGARTHPGTKGPMFGDTALPLETEAPVDWSRIESALRSTGHTARDRLGNETTNRPKSRSAKAISSHRHSLEDDGVESGRDVHAQYRKELIQMNRATAALRETATEDAEPEAAATWLEEIGEKVGDFLAEPSAAQILIVVLVIMLALALALAVALR